MTDRTRQVTGSLVRGAFEHFVVHHDDDSQGRGCRIHGACLLLVKDFVILLECTPTLTVRLKRPCYSHNNSTVLSIEAVGCWTPLLALVTFTLFCPPISLPDSLSKVPRLSP